MENIEVKCLAAVAIRWNQTWHLESQPDSPSACQAQPWKYKLTLKNKNRHHKTRPNISGPYDRPSWPTVLKSFISVLSIGPFSHSCACWIKITALHSGDQILYFKFNNNHYITGTFMAGSLQKLMPRKHLFNMEMEGVFRISALYWMLKEF